MKSDRGFTLVELMVSMAVFGIIIAGIYETYLFQQKAYTKQEQVANMQQNMRAALYFLKRDIRMAGYNGYNPAGLAGSTVTIARSAEFQFQSDADADGSVGGTNEVIRYALSNDANIDGIADGFPCNLGKDTGGGLQPVAENVEAIEFCYILEDGTITTAPAAADHENIRGVYISMLARTETPLNKGNQVARVYTQATNDQTLVPDAQWDSSVSKPSPWVFSDGYIRKMLITKVRCRNMGLDPYAD